MSDDYDDGDSLLIVRRFSMVGSSLVVSARSLIKCVHHAVSLIGIN